MPESWPRAFALGVADAVGSGSAPLLVRCENRCWIARRNVSVCRRIQHRIVASIEHFIFDIFF